MLLAFLRAAGCDSAALVLNLHAEMAIRPHQAKGEGFRKKVSPTGALFGTIVQGYLERGEMHHFIEQGEENRRRFCKDNGVQQ